MHGDIDYHVSCMETLTTTWHVWRNWPLCDMHGDIYRCVICMETFTTMWYVWRHLRLCDMYEDIWHHVICVKTLTVMWHTWRHLPLCDMYADIDRHMVCIETLTAMWHAWRHRLTCGMHGDIHHHVICVETFTTVWYAWIHWTQLEENKTLSYATWRKQDTVTHNLKKTRHCHIQLEENKTLSYTTFQCRLYTSQQLCDDRVGKQHCLDAGYLGLYNRQQVGVRLFPYRRRHCRRQGDGSGGVATDHARVLRGGGGTEKALLLLN